MSRYQYPELYLHPVDKKYYEGHELSFKRALFLSLGKEGYCEFVKSQRNQERKENLEKVSLPSLDKNSYQSQLEEYGSDYGYTLAQPEFEVYAQSPCYNN